MKAFAVYFSLCAAILCPVRGALAAPVGQSSSTSKQKISSEPPVENAWPVLTNAQQAESITELKQFADDATTKLSRPLKLYETKYFLSLRLARHAGDELGRLARPNVRAACGNVCRSQGRQHLARKGVGLRLSAEDRLSTLRAGNDEYRSRHNGRYVYEFQHRVREDCFLSPA